MKLDFVRNTKRNMLAGTVAAVLGKVFQFLNRTLFLWLLGPEYLGLNGLFSSVLGVLSLAELGFSSALVYAMYKPIAEDDKELLCAYLKFFRNVYRWVGATIFTMGLCLLPFLPNLVHGGIPSELNLRVLYVIQLLNTSSSYFLFAYRGSVLHAYHRGDLLVNLYTISSMAQYVVVFAILYLTRNYYHYVLANSVFTVINNCLIRWLAQRHFPYITPRGCLSAARRQRVMSDVKALFLHKLGGVLTYSVDNLVISSFLGLVAVAAYGNYYAIVMMAVATVSLGYRSMTAGFGNKIHTESKADNFRLFMRVFRLTMVAVAWFAALMAALYQPFMREWTKDDPSLIRHALTPALMVVYFHVSQARQTLMTFKGAAGLWRADRWKPIVGGTVNLVLNVGLVTCLPEAYKLDGVLLSTVVTLILIEMPWETRVVFKAIFGKKEALIYWRNQALFALLTMVLCAGAWAAAFSIPLDGIAGLGVKGCVAAAVAAFPLFILFRKDLAEGFRHVRE